MAKDNFALRQKRKKDLETTIEVFSKRIEKLKAISKKFSWYRLSIFAGGTVLFFILYFFVATITSLLSAAVIITVFGIVTKKHNDIDFAIKKNYYWIRNKEINLA